MSNFKKCIISRYDEDIEQPPYLTVPVDEVTVQEPKDDEGGSKFAEGLRQACAAKGYTFKFYTMASDKPGFDYEIVVY